MFDEDARYVNIGVKVDQPGLASYSKDPTNPEGFEVQLARSVAAQFQQRQARLINITSQTRESFLLENQAQMVIASYSMTDPRREFVDMIGPYLRSNTGIMVRSDYQGSDDVHSFHGADVCTAAGTTSVDLIKSELGQEPRTVPSFKDCNDMLSNREVSAVITDKIILEGFVQADPEFKLLNSEFGSDGYYGIAIPKGHPEECAAISKWLKTYIDSPEWRIHFSTYFPGVNPEDYSVGSALVDAKTRCTAEPLAPSAGEQ
ncbi:transporter substrate-binding domain-containing protein [Saccharopolyspora sp. 5N708]|uniref:transporter substrate-binding domain-containing protein n=1 Tax=Saccharopolyspora sp. 5N708 TaxID=3457424 RepID=UPI003FD45A37